MSNQAALDALGKINRVVKAFEDVDLVLKAVVGLEQNEKEIKQAVNVAREEKDKVDAELASVKSKLTKRKAEIDALNDEWVQQSAAHAEELAARIAATDKHLTDKMSEHIAQVERLNGEVDALNLAKQEAIAELDRVNSLIDQAKEKMSRFLG
jgi:chromosome segregation ATPase